MSNPVNLLDAIRNKPPMYLGEHTLTGLYYLYVGYQHALGAHGIKDDTRFSIPDDFHDWVAYRLHYKESTLGWRKMILNAVDNEREALDRFFELLDQYAARTPHIVATRDFPKEDAPATSISLFTYTDDPGFFMRSNDPNFFARVEFFPFLNWFETFTKIDRSQLTVIDAEAFARWQTDEE